MKALTSLVLGVSFALLSSTLAPAQDYSAFTVELGTANLVPNAAGGIPVYPWFPDGHITMLPDGDSFQMYWAGSSSYRSVGTSISNQTKNPSGYLLTKGPSNSDFDNGGAWLMSVFRQDGDNLIGFYHGEDHYWAGYPKDGTAWKSIAFCSSTNNGLTWSKGGQIITSPRAKPSSPTWGGSGDACVVYDAQNARWVCFYQEHWIYTAISTNGIPLPGTWKKYHNGGFTQPGIGGSETPVPGLMGHPGANPSVHFNTHLKKWVMVWHTWNATGLWLSISDDLLNWQAPINVVSASSPERKWYPTIIGRTDVLASEYANLYYAYWPDTANWQRQFTGVPVRFRLRDMDADGLPDAWEEYHWPGTPVALILPDADEDNDGQNHLDEYRADTDPRNIASCFRIMNVLPSSENEVVITWQSSKYKYYGIEMRTDLFASWTGIAGNIAATPPLNSFTNISGQPSALYRIKLEQD